jgi:hypothetical protein
MATVLFVCLHNAGRSQMSQALMLSAQHARSGKGQKGWMLRYIAGGIVMVLIGVLVAVLPVGRRRQDRGVL